MLTMKEISKTYGTGTLRTHALRSFSLDVREGDFVAVMGPADSGKTTFLNIAGLLESFDGGVYTLEGSDVAALSDRERARLRAEKIGFVFQTLNLSPDISVFDNVDVPLRDRGFSRAERRERIEAALQRVGLAGSAKHLPPQLSDGQQQRVGIARALAGEPRVLLADEPTGRLDISTARAVLDLLAEINAAGTTIVMVTRDPAVAERAKRSVRLLDGALGEDPAERGRDSRASTPSGGATHTHSAGWSFSEAPPGFQAPASAEE
ncbi:MAG TPA: ABC transporter ATP-binding protein [Gammaproteobacteria bacterium]|nr:ABC transporter ATP-binding protein [Gammaproteobacteria bacterium]